MALLSFDPSSIPRPSFQSLPDIPAITYLKSKRQWVAWKYEQKTDAEGKISWTKPPVCPHAYLPAKSNDPKTWGTYDQAVQRAVRSNLAGVGYVLTADDNLTGGDLDGCRDPVTGELDPWVSEIVGYNEAYVEISPSGEGLRLVWLGKISSAVALKPAGVEMYGVGRYLTITGDQLPGTPITLGLAPKTEAALRARAAAFKATKAPEIATAAPLPRPVLSTLPSSFFRNVNSAALAQLSSWVPTVFPGAKFQVGTQAYRISSRQLGRVLEEDLSIAPNGIVDFGVHDMGDSRDGKRSAIDIVIEHGGAPDARTAALWLCERIGRSPTSLGWEDDDGRGAALVEQLLAGQAAKILDAPIGLPNPLDALTLGQGVDWTRPVGLLHDMAEWILASSRRPNRPFAVVAALATLSAVCGRHLYGPTGTALNVYIVCLASTGVGKGRPLGAVAEILHAAKLDNLHTSGKLFSVSAIEALIKDRPCCVATVDEIGANLLSRMSHSKSSTHELAMRGALLELWSREQGAPPFATHGRAESNSVAVPCPSLSLFGVSTPEAFYQAVTSGSVRDGFLNRFLITNAAPRAKANEVSEDARRVPSRVVRELLDIVPEAGGNAGRALGVFSLLTDFRTTRLAWADEATKLTALDFEEQVLSIMDAHPEHAPLMGRIFEYTVRLASLHAVSREGRGASVTASDLAWGAALVIQSARAMLDGTSAMMAANDYEAKFNLVRNTIREAGKLGRNDLLRRIRSINAREREEIIRHLKEGGWIEDARIDTATKPKIGWKWVG